MVQRKESEVGLWLRPRFSFIALPNAATMQEGFMERTDDNCNSPGLTMQGDDAEHRPNASMSRRGSLTVGSGVLTSPVFPRPWSVIDAQFTVRNPLEEYSSGSFMHFASHLSELAKEAPQ